MTMNLTTLKQDLQKLADADRAKHSQRFFKTGKGQYGEGDIFIGIKTPQQRKLSRQYYKHLPLAEIEQFLHSKIHDHRAVALMILCLKFKWSKTTPEEQQKIYQLYLNNTKYINNWDLVDISAPKIVGAYLLNKKKQRSILYKLAKSNDLWEKRIAMLSCFAFIREKEFSDTLTIAKILVYDEHDLIHKAVGWMLREIGKRQKSAEEKFLDKYAATMPRTMLRYAIEKFAENKRQYYLKLKDK